MKKRKVSTRKALNKSINDIFSTLAKKYTKDYYIEVSAGILGSMGSIVAAWNRYPAYLPHNRLGTRL